MIELYVTIWIAIKRTMDTLCTYASIQRDRNRGLKTAAIFFIVGHVTFARLTRFDPSEMFRVSIRIVHGKPRFTFVPSSWRIFHSHTPSVKLKCWYRTERRERGKSVLEIVLVRWRQTFENGEKSWCSRCGLYPSFPPVFLGESKRDAKPEYQRFQDVPW